MELLYIWVLNIAIWVLYIISWKYSGVSFITKMWFPYSVLWIFFSPKKETLNIIQLVSKIKGRVADKTGLVKIVISQHTLLIILMCVNTCSCLPLLFIKLTCKIEENLHQNIFLMHIVASSLPHFLPLPLYRVFTSSSDLALGKSHFSAIGFSTFEKLTSDTLML